MESTSSRLPRCALAHGGSTVAGDIEPAQQALGHDFKGAVYAATLICIMFAVGKERTQPRCAAPGISLKITNCAVFV